MVYSNRKLEAEKRGNEYMKWMKEFERNQKVIDADLEKLSKSVKEKTMSAKGVYVGYVSEKPIEMIL